MAPSISIARRTRRNCAYFRDKMVAQTLSSLNPFKLLHYDVNTGNLKTFWCPAYCDTPIDICNWENYRQLHDFRYPCCLCPSEAPGDSMKYTECHILRTKQSSREDLGQWTAVCSERACGYNVRLEDCFMAAGFQCKNYPLRTPPLSANSLLQLALMMSSEQTAIDELLRLDSSNGFTRHFCPFIVVDLTAQSDSEEEKVTTPSMELD
ncbi:hypothetical protein FIBSPDRAFT_944702 [Athelia psychrophila]|uniref:Uncharacterized protein n=1 Tax=Athelia psychrophila TaxID=1759441 RepID=A0A166UXZ4_9AGAM|nr:hypothetical protein FIBSPDRAFT_944702 [Fibularhizoctonia sp. CBS 109695]